jgi:hypothetical protein
MILKISQWAYIKEVIYMWVRWRVIDRGWSTVIISEVNEIQVCSYSYELYFF